MRKQIRDVIAVDDATFKANREELLAKEYTPPARGRGGTDNFQTSLTKSGMIVTEEDRAFVGQLVREVLEAGQQPEVTNDDELIDGIDRYFARCSDRNILPTVEEMYLYCGKSAQWGMDIIHGRSKGFSPRTSTILKKARARMQSLDTKLVEAGKLNFLTYCFRAKNYYGMTDKSEVVITPSTGNPDEYNSSDIRGKYLSAADVIDITDDQ